MTHELYEEQVSALVDNELRDDEMELLFRHLGGCNICRRSFTAVLDLRSNLSDDVPLMAPRELDDKVLRQTSISRHLSADRKALPSRLWKRRISVPVPAAVAALLFIVMSVIVSVGSRQPESRPLEGRVEAVYITMLPAVEVQGHFP